MHAKQTGQGRNETITQGDRISGMGKECGGPAARTVRLTGTVECFVGGSHQHAVIRDDAGYTHTVDTHTAEKE